MQKISFIFLIMYLASVIGCASTSKIPKFHTYVALGNVTEVKGFLKEEPSLIRSRHGLGNTPLHRLAGEILDKNTEEVGRLLLQYKGDINDKRDFDGNTPLHRKRANSPNIR